MKVILCIGIGLVVFALSESAEEDIQIERHKRLSCQLGGRSLCSTSCSWQGRNRGGCCGQSGPCYNTCYCFGSGYEYRCGRCDLG